MKKYLIIIKKTVLTIFLIGMAESCKAQSTEIDLAQTPNGNYNRKNGSLYIKDFNSVMNPFIGTWKWLQGNQELTLTLTKQIKFHYNEGSDNFYEDRIVGYYTYKENGVIVADTSNDNLNDDYSMNVDINFYANNKNISIEDYLKNKTYHGWFELITQTQLQIQLKDDEHIRFQKEGYAPLPSQYIGNTFPLDLILIKQQ